MEYLHTYEVCFFVLFETVFLFFGQFPPLLPINQNSFIFFSYGPLCNLAAMNKFDVMEKKSVDENEMETEDTPWPGEGKRSNETTTLKSFKDVLDRVQNISASLIHRGGFKVANEFDLLGDKVGDVEIQRRSTRSRLERYFKAM